MLLSRCLSQSQVLQLIMLMYMHVQRASAGRAREKDARLYVLIML